MVAPGSSELVAHMGTESLIYLPPPPLVAGHEVEYILFNLSGRATKKKNFFSASLSYTESGSRFLLHRNRCS